MAPIGPSKEEVSAYYATRSKSYERKANRACQWAYERLVRGKLGKARCVLEIGAGSSGVLSVLDAPTRVACDMSIEMIQARKADPGVVRICCDGQSLPCPDAGFDAAFCINVLEHVPEPAHLISEATRILRPGGWFLAVTPNGDTAWLLNLIERLHLKIPEGPHRFLRPQELETLTPKGVECVEHQRFLAFPAGPRWFVSTVDRLSFSSHGWGLFHYILLRKCGEMA